MQGYSSEIAQAILGFLQGANWQFFFDDKLGVFRFWLAAKGKLKNLGYHVIVHESSYTVYVISPIGAERDDKNMMRNMAEFICRANYGIRNGNFELDFDDGEIRYKIYVDCGEGTATAKGSITPSVYVPTLMFQRYEAGIFGIVYQNMSAKEAIDICEGELKDAIQALPEETASLDDEVTKGMIDRLEERFGVSGSQSNKGTDEA